MTFQKQKVIVISNGMGSQSKLIPLQLYEKHPLLKEFWEGKPIIINIFADTGDEPDFIYKDIIEYQNYLKDHNYPPLIITNRHETYHITEKRMTQYYINHHIVLTRQNRHCTDKFKIRVMKKYLKRFFFQKFLVEHFDEIPEVYRSLQNTLKNNFIIF